jgi:hypothetical protein
MENGMPAQEQSAQEGGEGISDVVFNIQSQLVALLQTLDQSGVGDPQAKAELAQIIQAYRNFVKEKLGASPGKPEASPAAPQSLPPEAGANPNARPM